MLIQDMSNEQLRSEQENLKPYLIEAYYRSIKFYPNLTFKERDIIREKDKFHERLLQGYYFELNRELERRKKSKIRWKKWWREFRKRG